MPSRKSVRFDDRILHSDDEISYLWTEDDANDESLSAGESTETHRWSLTEGLPPCQPMRRNSPLTSGATLPPTERQRRTSPPDHPPAQDTLDNVADSTIRTPAQGDSSYIAIKGSLDGDMAKIASRDTWKSARLTLHDDDTEDAESSIRKSVRSNAKSPRSMMADLAGTDHWSPLTDDLNDYTPPTLPMRRGSREGLGLESSSEFKTEHTLSTLPEDEDDLSLSMDCDSPPPPRPPFDK
ncbi:MAG: hypothetical protein SGBAC_009870 [Bacillariaceae sp.]